MARSFDGIFGGIFDQSVFLRDSRHAANAYGLNKSDLSNGTPRHKFEFFVKIKFNTQLNDFVRAFLKENDQDIVHTMIKTVTMPSMNIDTEVLNQYNKKRISQTRIDYNPISITFHDSVEGRTLRLWEMYYEYYFRDGLANEKINAGTDKPLSFFDAFVGAFTGTGGTTLTRNPSEFTNDIIKDKFVDNYGYNLQRVGNQKYLIEAIEIYQIHGGKFSRTDIIRPRVTGFTHDTLDYEDSSGLVEMKLDFEYEGVVYANVNEKLSSEELERFRFGDFNEMASLITIRNPVNGRILSEVPRPPNVTTCGPGTIPDGVDEGKSSFWATPIGRGVGGIVGQTNLQLVQGSLSTIRDTIPGAIASVASTSIFGGTIGINPDPLQALKSSGNQFVRGVVNRTRDNFTAGVTAGISNVVTGFSREDDNGG